MSYLRVIAYVDGFNLYYGIRQKDWKHLYWIDPYDLADALKPSGSQLVDTKYFTARVKRPNGKRDRQTSFLDAVRARGKTEIIQGKFSDRTVTCNGCGSSWNKPEEKMTDSAIAAHLVADAFLDRFDVAIMIGGDTDIVPALRIVRTHFASKTLLAWYPPKRHNDAVGSQCHGSDTIGHSHLELAVMPDQIEVAAGVIKTRPPHWKHKNSP